MSRTIVSRLSLLAILSLSFLASIALVAREPVSFEERVKAQGTLLEDTPTTLLASNSWTSMGSLLTPRYVHTATLLSNGKVLVAGGDGGGGLRTSSEVYDPANGTFSATGSLNAARGRHTATLLPNGQVLVVGGGIENGASLSSAEIYDPAAGSWMTTGSMSAARQLHTATLLPDGKVLVVGGAVNGTPVNTAELYDPSMGLWTAAAPFGTARFIHTATLLPSGKILVAGGKAGGGASLSSAELYDPATGTWSVTGSLNMASRYHSATLMPDGQVLIAAGYNGGYLSRVETFNPSSGTFSLTGSLATARYAHTATLLPSGKILVAGGGSYLASAELYDPSSGVWGPTGSLSNARNQHAATLLPDGSVVVTGGDGLIAAPPAISEVYDPASGAFSVTAPLAIARYAHTATLLPSGNVLVSGGGAYLGSTELYDLAAGTWTGTGSLNSPRNQHTATLLSSGQVLMVGGDGQISAPPEISELYDPDTGLFTYSGTLNTPRYVHTATLLSNGKVLVAGGDGSGGLRTSSEVYDPANGTFSATGALNAARGRHTATLLPNGQVLVVGGGIENGASLSSAEIYDPAAGSWMTTGSMSAARQLHTATLLPDGKVLVVGGAVNGTPVNTAELYDPSMGLWTAAAPLGTARFVHTATLLPSGKILVAGGTADGGASLSSAELYEPATGTWSVTGSLNTASRYHSATLMPDGQVLIAAGYNGGYLSRAERYSLGTGFQEGWRPTILSITDPTIPGASVIVSGTLFTGLHGNGPESSGGGYQSSPSNYPLLQLRQIGNERTLFLPLDPSAGFTATLFTSSSDWTAQNGPALATIITNGIPSISRLIQICPCSAPSLIAEPAFTAGTSNQVGWFTVADATGYVVEASTDNFGSVFQSSGSIAATSHLFTSLSGGVNYQYRVKTVFPWAESEWSAIADSTQDTDIPSSEITNPLSNTILYGEVWNAAGTGTDATSGIALVELSWDGGATWHATTGTTSWAYSWTLPPDGNYTLLCRATDIVGNSETQHGVPVIVRNRPLPPTNLVAQDVPYDGGGVIALSWTLSGDDGAGLNYIVGYAIYRANAAGGPFTQIGFVPAGTDSYQDATAGTGVNRWYRVRAITDADVWPNYTDSNIAGPVQGTDDIPLPINNLQADLTYSCNVRLTWIESPSPDILLYNIYYDAGTGVVNFTTPLATLSAPSTTWVSSGLTLGTRYLFAVRAKDTAAQDDGLTTNVVSIATDCAAGTVRAQITHPEAGRRIQGNQVTVRADLIQGTRAETQQVLLQYRVQGEASWVDIPVIGNDTNPDPQWPYLLHWDVSALSDGNYDLQAVAYTLAGTPDPAPPFITVQVVATGANISESLQVGGDHAMSFDAYRGSGNSTETAFDRDQTLLQIRIPKGSFPVNMGVLEMRDLDPALYEGFAQSGFVRAGNGTRTLTAQLTPTGIYRKLTLPGGQTVFSSSVDLIFFYRDDNGDGIVDGTTVPAQQLDVFREESAGDWSLQNVNRSVDLVNRFIRVSVSAAGTFGLFSYPKPASVSGLMVTKTGTSATLNWAAVTQDEKGNPITVDYYNVYLGASPSFAPDLVNHSNRLPIPNGQVTSTTSQDDQVPGPGEVRYYLVTAVDGLGRESYPR